MLPAETRFEIPIPIPGPAYSTIPPSFGRHKDEIREDSSWTYPFGDRAVWRCQPGAGDKLRLFNVQWRRAHRREPVDLVDNAVELVEDQFAQRRHELRS